MDVCQPQLKQGEHSQCLLLEQLSEDILALIIMEYIYDPKTKDHISLSHTCRSLRRMILALSLLWSSLHSDMSTGQVRAYLNRSGDANLKIKLLRPRPGIPLTEWFAFLTDVLCHTHRWYELVFDPGTHTIGRRLYTRLNHELSGLELPRLKSLSLMFWREVYWQSRGNAATIERPDFYTTWTTPSLTMLTFVPTRVHTDRSPLIVPGYPSVKSLNLVLYARGVSYTEWREPPSILHSLSTLPWIVELTLTTRSTFVNTNDMKKLPTVELNQLRTLSVITNFRWNRWEGTPGTILNHLQMPSLIKYQFEGGYLTYHKNGPYVDPSFYLDSAPLVQELTLANQTEPDILRSLELIFSTYTNLQILKIRTVWVLKSFNIQHRRMPPLRQVHFVNCTFQNDTFVDGLESAIRSGRHSTVFEGFIFDHCNYEGPERLSSTPIIR